MKWFKKDSNFYSDNRVIECKAELGLDGLVLYDILLCALAEQWNGEPEKTFIIHEAKLLQSWGKYRPKLDQTLTKLASLFNITSTKVGPNYHIQYPKFLKKQASYFNVCRQKTKSVKDDKNRIDKNTIVGTSKIKEAKEKPKTKEILDYFSNAFSYKHNKPYFISSYPKEMAIIKRLLETLSLDEIKILIDKFFKSDDKFICQSDYGIGMFSTQINKLRTLKIGDSIVKSNAADELIKNILCRNSKKAT